VRVVRGRAEDQSVIDEVGSTQWVTARAVAPMDRLVRWCLPLLAPGGHLLAMKGRSAADELAQHSETVRRLGGRDARVVRCAIPGSDEPISVIDVRRTESRGKKGST
jgi:16S rRNA (guanine527-N7)-methyltransferase